MKTKETYEAEILKVIAEENIYSISDIFTFYKGCGSSTFYNHGLEKVESIKKAIEDNKIITKQTLKKKWLESDNPTLQLALYKSICTDDERRAVSMSYTDVSTLGQAMNKNLVELTPETIAALVDKL